MDEKSDEKKENFDRDFDSEKEKLFKFIDAQIFKRLEEFLGQSKTAYFSGLEDKSIADIILFEEIA